MNAGPHPQDEIERLERLRELVVLDSPPEALFDGIARLASELCGVPIALISLVDAERQWFKANVGLPGVNETPRDVAFCACAVTGDGLFEVPDATLDPRFASNPLVTGAPDIRFYAGAPLCLPGGARVGTLCVIDRQARRLNAEQAATLQSLAAIATQALLMRRELITRSLAVRSEYERALAESGRRYRSIVEDQAELVSLAQADGLLLYVNPAYARHFGRTPEELSGANLYDLVEVADRAAVRALLNGLLADGQPRSTENRMVSADGSERWVAWTNTLHHDAGRAPWVHSVGRDISAHKRAETALRASEDFLARVGRVAGVGGWQLDLASGAVFWSQQTRHIHEVEPDYQPTLESGLAFCAPESRAQIEAAVAAASVAGGPGWDLEVSLVTARGRPIWVRTVGEAEFADGRPVRLVGALQDITERKLLAQREAEARRQLQQQTATLSAVAEAIPAMVAVVGADRRYRFINSGFERWIGAQRDRVIGRTLAEVLGRSDSERSQPWVDRVLAGESVNFERDYPARQHARHLAISYIPLWQEGGVVDGFVGIAQDITQTRQEEVRLLKLAQRDALTGLLNRAGFEAEAASRLQDAGGAALALLYVDLDRFKPVNDQHGHPVGDQLLRQFAQRLQALVRPTDAVARLGGDEFALLLSGVREAAHANSVAEKVVEAAQQPFEIGTLRLSISASVGAAFGVHPAGSFAELVARADALLYRAKQAGRGRQVGEGA